MRIAERRGLLTGSNVSVVQAFAVELLMLIDLRKEATATAEQFRMSLATANPQFIGDLYPEWVKRAEEEAKAEQPEADDETDLVWSVPTSEEEADAIDALINDMMARSMSGSEISEDGWM